MVVATSLLSLPALAQGSTGNNAVLGPSLCNDVKASAVSAVVGHRVQQAVYGGIATLSGSVHGPATEVGCIYWPPGATPVVMATSTQDVDFSYYLWAKPFSAAEYKDMASAKGVLPCPGLTITAFCVPAGKRRFEGRPVPNEFFAVQGRRELAIYAYKLPLPKLSLLAELAIPAFFGQR